MKYWFNKRARTISEMSDDKRIDGTDEDSVIIVD